MYRSTTRVSIGTAGGAFGRRFDSTLQHIKKGGLPVNPKILGEIKQKLKSGLYKDNRDQLIADLKNDPYLFLYAVKRIHELGTDTSEDILPETELKKFSEEKLQKIFDINESDVSAYRIRNSTSVQSLRMQHSIISSVSAATIAQKVELSSEEAFSLALFRQLGLNLISWNYPDQYKQALRLQKSGDKNLESEIERLIGVNPISIARKLAADWRMSTNIKRILTTDPALNIRSEKNDNSVNPLTLSEICDLSELFAKANDSEFYPGSADEWRIREAVIKDVIGQSTIDFINQRIDFSLNQHEQNLKFKPTFIIRSDSDSATINRRANLKNENHYLGECCASIRENFTRIYEIMESDSQVSLNALKVLVENVIPSNGFSRGCLYLLDEKDLILTPALRIGDKPITYYSTFKTHQNNLVTSAIDSVVPIVQRGSTAKGTDFCLISGALGSSKQQGVLYIEAIPEYFNNKSHDLLLYYHMIRVTLMDCLGMPQAVWPDKKSKRALLYTGDLFSTS